MASSSSLPNNRKQKSLETPQESFYSDESFDEHRNEYEIDSVSQSSLDDENLEDEELVGLVSNEPAPSKSESYSQRVLHNIKRRRLLIVFLLCLFFGPLLLYHVTDEESKTKINVFKAKIHKGITDLWHGFDEADIEQVTDEYEEEEAEVEALQLNITKLSVYILSSQEKPSKSLKPLKKLLETLKSAEYDGDHVDLHFVFEGVTRPKKNPAVSFANKFPWTFGEKKIVILPDPVGLDQAWLHMWQPDGDRNERVLFLEEHVVLSPLYYRWLKSTWIAYGWRHDIAGVALDYVPEALGEVANPNEPFGYRHVGRVFSPAYDVWKEFLSHDLSFESSDPEVWTEAFDVFCKDKGLFTVYLNSEAGPMASVGGSDPVLPESEWDNAWYKPITLEIYDFQGDVDEVKTKSDPLTPEKPEKKKQKEKISRPTPEESNKKTRSPTPEKRKKEKKVKSPIPQKTKSPTPEKKKRQKKTKSPTHDALSPESLLSGNMLSFPELRDRAKEVEKNGTVMLQLLNGGFVDFTKNWICNVKGMEHVLSRTLLICTDTDSYEKLAAFSNSSGIPLNLHLQEFESAKSLSYGRVNYYLFMLFRTSILKYLLDSGLNVFLTEADSTWFENPVKEIEALLKPFHDMAYMADNYMDTKDLNGGFLWIKATNASVYAIDHLYVKQLATMRSVHASSGENIQNKGNEQKMWRGVIATMAKNPSLPKLNTLLLPPPRFSSGQWFHRYHILNEMPTVVLNNWISDKAVKTERVSVSGWKWLSDNRKVCVADRVPTTAIDTTVDYIVGSDQIKNLVDAGKKVQGDVVHTILVDSAELPLVKRWWKDASKEDIERTLLVCVSKSVYGSVVKIAKSSKMVPSLALLDNMGLSTRKFLRPFVGYILMRGGMSVAFESFRYGKGVDMNVNVGAATDVVMTYAKVGDSAEPGLLYFRKNKKVLNYLIEYVFLTFKAAFHETHRMHAAHDLWPEIKRGMKLHNLTVNLTK